MSDGGKGARSDLKGGAGWVGFGLLILIESLRMERFTSMGASLYAMPGFVPGLIGCTLMLLGLALMARGWRRRTPAAEPPAQPQPPLFNRRVLITLALCLLYAAGLLGRVPFWLCTALFTGAFVALFMPPELPIARRAGTALAAAVLTSLVVTLVFQQVFLVQLP